MTTADLSHVPGPLRSLIGDLEREGFSLARDEGSGSVNRSLEWHSDTCWVRAVADRGEWWVELGGPALDDWFDPDVWTACLDGVPVRLEPAGMAEWVDFVRRRWRDVARSLATATEVADCLLRARSERARARLGFSTQGDD